MNSHPEFLSCCKTSWMTLGSIPLLAQRRRQRQTIFLKSCQEKLQGLVQAVQQESTLTQRHKQNELVTDSGSSNEVHDQEEVLILALYVIHLYC